MGSPARLLIWGASGHARVIADIVRATGRFEIAGFLDDVNHHRAGEEFCGAKVLGGSDLLARLRESGVADHAFVAFGNCRARLQAADRLRAAGFQLPTLVHPSAIIGSGSSIGEGSVVMPGVVINAGTVVGAHVIVNTSASIDHDCTISDGAHVCPGVRVAGGVKVGRAAWLGIGSIVINDISIGDGAVIGAGAVVIRDIPPGTTAYGVPARPGQHARREQ